MDTTTVAAISLVAVILGLIVSLAMILHFFWKVYDRGGASDLRDAAKAVRKVWDPEWSAKVLRFRKGASKADEANTETT